MINLHKYKNFKLTCKECGSEDVYVWQNGYYILLVCNNPECGKEERVLEIMEWKENIMALKESKMILKVV